jgi:hypothetical protein
MNNLPQLQQPTVKIIGLGQRNRSSKQRMVNHGRPLVRHLGSLPATGQARKRIMCGSGN